MSGSVGDRKRLITITAGNLRQNHIYLTGHYDFFPKDSIGESKQKNGEGKPIQLTVQGLDSPVHTDIGCDPKSGKPRRFFRRRKWVKQFFEKHNIKEGDVLAIEKIGRRKFRIYPFEARKHRDLSWWSAPKSWSSVMRVRVR